ncbi:glycoside hydrolase family 15 protein [Labrys miyagiensis]|uniref:glycoside hydrolase family 15 protein n=1 Tax=Labrys miyagiensis TaxID=346912 RepID=UPI0024E14D1F|nr:glycoside hydrolase family 15 protein [Labrys miyagiensis]
MRQGQGHAPEGRDQQRSPRGDGAALRIEDYGLIGDCRTAALVGRNGSVDWLCWPRFDSAACLAALLGTPEHGRWTIAPADPAYRVGRSYRGDTMILETTFETEGGSFMVTDFMPIGEDRSSLVRIVEGLKGTPSIRMELLLRFDYGSSVPWVTQLPEKGGIVAIAGPNLVVLRSPMPLHGEHLATVAEFMVEPGERVPFVLSYGPSHLRPPIPLDAGQALADTEKFWLDWAGRCRVDGRQGAALLRSLLTLKALTFSETGGMVAAPTTSLPELIGGERNWDYRFCWLRDAALTLVALLAAGYQEEASAWRNWLHRSVAGSPEDLQIMYGLAGERRLTELEIPWLPGYRDSRPVRIGNAASVQLQLDVWGELVDALHLAREGGLDASTDAWDIQRAAVEHLEGIWQAPDDGIWEIRGARRHFTHSKIMAWVAFDRSIRDAEKYGFEAPLERWRVIRGEIHALVCELGFDKSIGSFTQTFGCRELDASLLLIPEVGFLPIEDPRVAGTIAAVERELVVDGFVRRYHTRTRADGLQPGEGVFLACSFWLVDAWQRQGREKEAHALIERLLALRNDLGLLSEEYDTERGEQTGNFPQAFSHLSLVRSALSLHLQMPARHLFSKAGAPGRGPGTPS